MLRSALLYLSNQQQLFRFVSKNRLAKRFARRFIAGETLEETMPSVAELNSRAMTASLDLLGESVTNEREARAAGAEYIRMLHRIAECGLDANVSVKLTAMGLDISEDLCVAVMHEILDCARHHQSFVRIDMEGSEYTERTLRLFEDRLYPPYSQHVGIVLQSYLYRTMADVERAIELRARVRLCKGAYQEPETVAYPDKREVDANFVRCMHRLMLDGNYPGLATHDEAMITEAKRFAKAERIPPDRYEFQMLFGVRRDLQQELVRDGYRLRIYVPFGTQWYPYLMRRLAERPANLAFITGSVLKEAVRRAR